MIYKKLNQFDEILDPVQWIKNIAKCVIEVLSKGDSKDNILVRDIKKIIESRYSRQLTVNSIAKEVNFSRIHVHRVFSRITGMTILEYLTQYRMEMAKELLIMTNLSLDDIAENVGYNDRKYFQEKFVKYTGQTPSAYRKEKRE